jgi:hypothetical protein
LFILAVAALVIGWWWNAARTARAVIDPSCAGNVCSATAGVGGQDVEYSWTQNHDGADASLKVRFRSGPYSANANPVRFKITVSQPFSSHAALKNPSPGTSLPPSETVNDTDTSIERSAPSSLAGQTFDFTLELRYASPPPGTIAVTLEFAQYGAGQTVGPFNVFLDAASPSNRDEGESMDALYGAGYRECNDGTDNDLDYRADCADADCAGEEMSPSSVCESPETTCNDDLDNDGNGKTDCGDPLCNGRPGNAAGTKFCGPENGGVSHANCADGFDNDRNSETDCTDDSPGTGCWRSDFQDCRSSESSCIDNIDNDRDKDYDEGRDANAGTGVDCRDYDCKGQGNCTTNERKRYDSGSGTFVDDASQCFSGVDEDLDDDVDCADVDCLGVVFGAQRCAGYEAYLPQDPLGDGDPLPLFYFNFCSDTIDNDGDVLADAQDLDCKNRFGECGPSPATEDYTFLSCSDALDNDVDTTIDCADAQCRSGGKLGRAGCLDTDCGAPPAYDALETDAAVCAASENSSAVCGDGLDNDADGQADCADAGCTAPAQRHGPTVGSQGPPYFCGAESGAVTCHDGADNDSDAGTDCFDSACQDAVQCARRPATGGWTVAVPFTCLPIPFTVPPAPIVAGGGTQFSYTGRIHVSGSGETFQIRFIGSGTYTSLTIVVGDAVNTAQSLPFPMTNCSLAGTGASQMQYLSTDPEVGTIFEKAGETLNGFDVTLTCTPTSATPTAADDFSVGIVANRNGAVEFGENTGVLQIYENTAPTLPNPAIDAEGIVSGTVDVPVGGSVRFQALPDTDPSGICRCGFTLEGAYVESADGNCLVTTGPFANDNPTYDIAASAVDGADNRSATSTPQVIAVNVVPSVLQNLVLGVDANGATVRTFRGGETMNLTAVGFRTDTASDFAAPNDECRVYVYDASWSGGLAATASMIETAFGTDLTCLGTYLVPAALAAGRYWIFVEATDSSGDVIRSNVQPFLKCDNGDLGIGDCKDADFDNDGTPEGRYTPNASYAPPGPQYFGDPTPRACDNCVNFYNPNQRDEDANGIGDSCEAGAVGRCKYKRCGSTPNDLTPGPYCLNDEGCDIEGGESCIVVHQEMCTINCSDDSDCSPPTAALSGTCSLDWGLCAGPAADEGNCCFVNADCLSNECTALVKPFLETFSGQLYSAGDLQAAEEPPLANASFCLQANGLITNFSSASGCELAGSPVYELPKKEKGYVGSFGALDVNGILNGKYGQLDTPASLPDQLGGKIYYFPNGLTVNAPITFKNSTGIARANGLVVVKGDLTIAADLAYQDQNESDLKHLASIGWIVLKQDDDSGGDILIQGGVRSVVGAFFAEDVIDTGESSVQLTATGMFVGKNLTFRRTYASRTAGSEQVRFDARVILNPPPGMADVTRSLPGFKSVPGQ